MRNLAALLTALWASQAVAHDYPFRLHEFIDADTFDGEIVFPERYGRFRLYCINAAESDTAEGQALTEAVRGEKIRRGRIEVVGRDAFGRWLVWFTPRDWDRSLNHWLHERGAPLYARLTQRERAICEERLK